MSPPQRREHEYQPDHPRRPMYFPDVTLGNLLAIAVFLASGAGVYAANESRTTKLETQVTMQDQAQKAAMESQAKLNAETVRNIERRLDSLEIKIDKVLSKLGGN